MSVTASAPEQTKIGVGEGELVPMAASRWTLVARTQDDQQLSEAMCEIGCLK